MATGTLRILLVAAGLAIGVFVLAKAFPEGDVVVPVSGGPADDGGATPPAGTDGDGNEDGQQELGDGGQGTGGDGASQDVSIQVLNGTGEPGLAEDTAEFIESSLGYRDVIFGDADTDADSTTIFFASGFRDEARKLRDDLYPDAALQGGTAGDAAVDITVVLGTDYVQAN